MKKQKLQLVLMACAMGIAVQSHAQMFDITFTGGSSAANGQIDVVGGIATSGYLVVTAGANQGTYNFVSLTSPLISGGTPSEPSVRFTDGTDQIFDDVVNVSSNPYLTGDGLEFANDHLIGFNLWGNSPDSYSLFDVSGPPDTHEYIIDNGIATITPVPEPTTAGCFLLGLGALACFRRFTQNRRS
jgi:hypothetical protein